MRWRLRGRRLNTILILIRLTIIARAFTALDTDAGLQRAHAAVVRHIGVGERFHVRAQSATRLDRAALQHRKQLLLRLQAAHHADHRANGHAAPLVLGLLLANRLFIVVGVKQVVVRRATRRLRRLQRRRCARSRQRWSTRRCRQCRRCFTTTTKQQNTEKK